MYLRAPDNTSSRCSATVSLVMRGNLLEASCLAILRSLRSWRNFFSLFIRRLLGCIVQHFVALDLELLLYPSRAVIAKDVFAFLQGGVRHV